MSSAQPTAKRKKTFTEEDVRKLSEYVSTKPLHRILASEIAGFYSEYPELEGSFSGRLSTVAKLFPNLIQLEKDSFGGDWICSSRGHNTGEEANQTDVDQLLCEAIKTFGEFLRNRPEESLTASRLYLFYDRYPQFRDLLTGRFGSLATRYPDEFAMEAPVGGGQTIFRAVRKGTASKDTSRTEIGSDAVQVFEIDRNERIVVTSNAEVVRDWIGSMQRCSCVGLNVEGNSFSLALIILAIEGAVYIVDVLHVEDAGHFCVESGICDLLASDSIAKVCFDASRIRSFFGGTSIPAPRKLWDVRVAAKILSNSTGDVEASLGDILEDYEVQIPFAACREAPDWSARPLTEEARTTLDRSCRYLCELFQRMWEDAYSRNQTAACLLASERAWIDGAGSKFEDTLAKRLMREPNTHESYTKLLQREGSTSFSAAQSFRARLSAAKRSEALRQQDLPPNACFHFHVATPGECRQGDSCKFLHDLSVDVD